jgi:hypothetical protein
MRGYIDKKDLVLDEAAMLFWQHFEEIETWTVGTQNENSSWAK